MSKPPLPDVVIPLGTGSWWQDNELRYSLRSLHRHLPHGKVIVVGARPPWLRNVVHIPARDPHRFPSLNTMAKLRTALTSGEVGERFVLMNDDFFFLRDFDELPVYHGGSLYVASKFKTSSYHGMAITSTWRLLAKRMSNARLFDLHFPTCADTDRALDIMDEVPRGTPFLFATLYHNRVGTRATKHADFKVRRAWKQPAPSCSFVSVDDGVVSDFEFRAWARRTYPDPSPFEAPI